MATGTWEQCGEGRVEKGGQERTEDNELPMEGGAGKGRTFQAPRCYMLRCSGNCVPGDVPWSILTQDLRCPTLSP